MDEINSPAVNSPSCKALGVSGSEEAVTCATVESCVDLFEIYSIPENVLWLKRSFPTEQWCTNANLFSTFSLTLIKAS